VFGDKLWLQRSGEVKVELVIHDGCSWMTGEFISG
jgi:hypothetical protein